LITKKSKYSIIVALPLLLTGCLGTQHLEPGQKRLIQQSIKAPSYIDEEALRDMYAQRPNRRLLGLPIYHTVAIYYWGLRNYDRQKYIRKKEKVEKKFDAKIARTSSQRKINNYQFRKQKKIDKLNTFIEVGNQRMQWGEPVAVYDSGLIEITVNRFKNYLFSEGYFQNSVTPKANTFGRFVSMSYIVETGAPYIIDTIFYRLSDSTIYKILKANEAQSFIQRGEPYREENFSRERERIDLLLKDNGYYDFSRQYLDFPIDTAMLGNKRIAVMIEILDPSKRGYHKQFVIDSVRFTTDAGLSKPGKTRKTKIYRDVKYNYFDNLYSLKILSQRVFLSPGNLYSRTNTFTSQRQLANLDAFRFVNINYDTSGGNFIANIYTTPLSRYEWSNEVGVNVTQGYPGPFYNLNFKKRNIFRGLENFEFTGRIGFEGVASYSNDLNVYKSTEAGANASIIFPQFIWPLRQATQFRVAKYNPKTRVAVAFSYTDRPEYSRANLTFSNTYTWQNKRTTQFSLALTNVSLINSKLDPVFQVRLDELSEQGNYNLSRSFLPSLVNSMIFGITWNHNYGSSDKNSLFIRGQVESGGTSLNFINTDWITDRGLQFFKYVRLNLDFRRVRILNKWAHLAYRVNSGLAYSYGSDKALPYEKYYFAGGSNSVRAWRPRRLGIGSVPPDLSTDPEVNGYFNYQFEKPGEILIEGSVELRSKIAGFLDAAVFLDAGNVWLFSQQTRIDPTTEQVVPVDGNSKFKINSFYKEIGVGTGVGVRFDFTFLILRFDVGMKLYDPARDAGERFVLDKIRLFKPYAKLVNGQYTNFKEPVIYNIGIGYPF
jgi:outer membrane protein insertion porin family